MHELDKRTDGQGYAVFSVRESMWHQLGTVIEQAPTREKAMELAGHNFEVEVEPIFRRKVIEIPAVAPHKELERFIAEYMRKNRGRIPNGKVLLDFVDHRLDRGDEAFVPIQGHGTTVRTDRDEVLGVVGGRYTPLQNDDAFAVLDPLLDSGVLTLETGGTLRGGRDVWMQGRINLSDPDVRDFYHEHGLRPFVLISNNHTGVRQVNVKSVTERAICANTLEIAHAERGPGFKVRHTASVEANTAKAARDLFKGLERTHWKAMEQYEKLIARQMDEAMFRKLVQDRMAPLPRRRRRSGEPKENARQEAARARIEAKRARLLYLWENGDGHTGEHNAWYAYNAVTQSLDHDQELWRTRGGKEGRVSAMTFGSLAKAKVTVLNGLLDPERALARLK